MTRSRRPPKEPWPRHRAGLLSRARDHLRIARDTGRFISERLGTSLLVWLLVGIALALPAGLYLLQVKRWSPRVNVVPRSAIFTCWPAN